MAGRKPKPTNIIRLEGNPGKRPLNDREPQPKTEIPDCPEFLNEVAKAEWNRMAPHLKTLRLITQIDMAALAGYCHYYAIWKDASEKLADDYISISDKGNEFQNPLVGTMNTAFANMLKCMVEFGMTPSSRSRLKVEPNDKKQKSQMEGLLNNAV